MLLDMYGINPFAGKCNFSFDLNIQFDCDICPLLSALDLPVHASICLPLPLHRYFHLYVIILPYYSIDL